MKRILFTLCSVALLAGTGALSNTSWDVEAKDVYVKGYYRKDGTYVRPHVRSAPNQYRWDNYGPSRNSSELMNPRTRDYDRDGIPNYRDRDDDNDGRLDDQDSRQYGRDRGFGGSYNPYGGQYKNRGW
jgi:hypothetical protein